MEELDIDNEDAIQEMEEIDRKRRSKRTKKNKTVIRERSESDVRRELGLNDDLSASCRLFSVFAIVFMVMAMIGGLMQLAHNSSNKFVKSSVQQQKNLDVSVTREVFIHACETTWQATKLWSRLLVAILLPTSHQTFRVTKEGFSAMQPSIRASWNFFLKSHWTTKAALIGAIFAVICAFILQREIRRRRCVERVQAWYSAKAKAVTDTYDAFAAEVRRESKILADLLPHLLFTIAALCVALFGRAQFTEWARGLGGWYVVIGFPIILSARALIVYDLAYRKKVEKYHGVRRRTFSHFPTPESPETQQFSVTNYFSSFLPPALGGGHRRNNSGGSGDDETSSIGSLDSVDVGTVNGVHYPRRLEDDPEASLEQYNELKVVIYYLQYWSVIGMALLLEQLPITGHFLAVLPFWPPIRCIWALWLLLPGTSGAQLGFRLIVPLINRYMGDVETPTVSIEQQNMIVNFLFAFRLISSENRVKLAEIFQSGGTVLMVALPFFFLPASITGIGAIVIGIGRPIVSATRALVAVERAHEITEIAAQKQDKESMKRFRSNSNGVSISNGAVQITQLLELWIVYTLVMLVHGVVSLFLFWFPFYYHGLLVLTLWLQLPYFRGAHHVFKIVLKLFYKIRAHFVKDEFGNNDKKAAELPTINEESEEPEENLSKKEKKKQKKQKKEEESSGAWYSGLFGGGKAAEPQRASSKRSSKSSRHSSTRDAEEAQGEFDDQHMTEEELEQELDEAVAEQERYSVKRDVQAQYNDEDDDEFEHVDEEDIGYDDEDYDEGAEESNDEDEEAELEAMRRELEERERELRLSKKRAKKKERKERKKQEKKLLDEQEEESLLESNEDEEEFEQEDGRNMDMDVEVRSSTSSNKKKNKKKKNKKKKKGGAEDESKGGADGGTDETAKEKGFFSMFS